MSWTKYDDDIQYNANIPYNGMEMSVSSVPGAQYETRIELPLGVSPKRRRKKKKPEYMMDDALALFWLEEMD